MSEVDFLVGQTAKEMHYSVPGNLRIVFDPGERVPPALYADVGPFEFRDREGRVHAVDPADPKTVGPVLATVGRRIDSADTQGGALTLEFSDGSRIRCEPHEEYEAWEVVGGSPNHLVVSGTGGELLVWGDEPETPQ
jgi:hypothetical protein